MIAAVLRRHPRRTVRELIALLDQEYRWKTSESAVTGHLYTRRGTGGIGHHPQRLETLEKRMAIQPFMFEEFGNGDI